MNISIFLKNPVWIPVFTIQKGTVLSKGRQGVYWAIREAAAKVGNKYICYSWSTGEQILYCGSVAADYKSGRFTSNLEGRVHNYLSNHRVKVNGRINTNKNVFDHISSILAINDVTLSYLIFDELILGDEIIKFEAYSINPELIHAVEQLLICSYKQQGLELWNRLSSLKYGIEKTVPPKISKENGSLSDLIRNFIVDTIISPAREQEKKEVTILAKHVHKDLGLVNRMPSICQVLDNESFQHIQGLTLIDRRGPKRGANSEWAFEL